MSRILYDVDMVDQQSSPICWLACAAMVLQFKNKITYSAEELGVAGLDFRLPWTTPGRGAEQWGHLEGLGFFNCRSSTLPVWESILNQQLIYLQLEAHGPFILHHYTGSFSYGPGVRFEPGKGHSVLITGIDTGRGVVWFNNPWGAGHVNVETTSSSIIGAIQRWERNPASHSVSWN